MIKSSGHAVFELHYHIVFATKYRHACLSQPMLARVRDIIAGLCKDWRCELLECNGEADHVHLLLSGHPSVNMAQLVRTLKTVTARRLRAEFAEHLKPFYWKPVLWEAAYALFTVGSTDLSIVKKYIRNQASPD